MAFLFIGSTGNRAGQSLIARSIAMSLKERGVLVGFMKPVGTDPINLNGVWSDHDALRYQPILSSLTAFKKAPEPSSPSCWSNPCSKSGSKASF
jgi:BioD-like phosphotransacetylase family protein